MTKQIGLDEMWNRLSEKEKVHFETKYLIDLCECARKDGRRKGRLEAYKEIIALIDKGIELSLLDRWIENKIEELGGDKE